MGDGCCQPNRLFLKLHSYVSLYKINERRRTHEILLILIQYFYFYFNDVDVKSFEVLIGIIRKKSRESLILMDEELSKIHRKAKEFLPPSLGQWSLDILIKITKVSIFNFQTV